MKDLYKIEDWTSTPNIRLGEIFIESGKINLYHLSMALDVQRFKNISIGKILLELKVITKEDLKQAILIQEAIKKYKNV